MTDQTDLGRTTTAMPDYQHGEAFRLMKYRAEDGSEEEVVWNSRDGVTPFVITLRSGKSARHVDWHEDRRIPDYQPPIGSRVFVDLAEDAARELALTNAQHYFDGELGGLARREYGTVAAMAEALAVEYWQPGAPNIIEIVTGQELDR